MYEVFSKPGCGFCVRAKDLLDILGEDYTDKNIQESGVLDELTAKLGYPPKTVPQIFLDGKHIGGFTELNESLK